MGAVNMEETPCSERTRKNAPGSGVPTGLPCKQTGQQQWVTSQTIADNSGLLHTEKIADV